ncbi:MAG: DNA polymerase Y family protein, partial [Luteimonas sp.]
EQLRERLRARLGDEALYQLAATADPRPERAWRKHGSPVTQEGPPRPTWLLKRPIPLHDRQLTILSGPERLESGWWDGEDTRRDYYVLRTSQGQHAWAFTGIGAQGPWMLHGWFA